MFRLSKTLVAAAAGVALIGPLSASAALWRSTDFGCSVNLPDGDSRTTPWAVLTPNDILAQETGLVGARKVDSTVIVYLGIVRLDDKPHFQLNRRASNNSKARSSVPHWGLSTTLNPSRATE